MIFGLSVWKTKVKMGSDQNIICEYMDENGYKK